MEKPGNINYGKEELKSYKLSASRSGFFLRVCLSISETNSAAEQPNLEMLKCWVVLTSSGEGWALHPPRDSTDS